MLLDQKNWACDKKLEARRETIIDQYRKHFAHCTPVEREYWTMAGQCAVKGEPLDGCEFLQVVNEGLIEASQFRGVEINRKIHDANVSALPEVQWFHGDFFQVMKHAAANGEFHPAIVNADLIQSAITGAAYVASIMALLTATADDVMLVANFILKMRWINATDIYEYLNKEPSYRWSVKTGKWKLPTECYQYPGTGRTPATMGTLIFIKE